MLWAGDVYKRQFSGRIRSWKGADKMLHYLNKEEKNRSRELWEQAFPEDSDCFRDYYYTAVSYTHLDVYKRQVSSSRM